MTKSSIKEHVYQFGLSSVILKSLLVWILFAAQLIVSFFIVYNGAGYEAMILSNLILSLFTIPSLIIHMNHLKYSKNAKLILRYETITMINPIEEITLKNVEITEIILHQSRPSGSRFPWWNYSWIELVDKNGRSIKISFYLLEIGEFWLDTLSRRVDSNNFIRKENFFPIIK